jgi:release factor glutamine methyltransferase
LKIKEALQKGAEILKKYRIETPVTDSQLLLSYVLNIPRWKLITERELEIPESKVNEYFNLIKKRAEGFPVAYLTHKKEFFGLDFYIEEGVLIPRPETEILVEEVLKKIPENKEILGLEIGVGSGAIVVSLLKNRPKLKMYGVDISEKALEITKKNAKIHGVEDRLVLVRSNLFENLPKIKFDFIVSNPPYVSEKEYEKLQKEVKKEPKTALVGGTEGFEIYEKIVKEGINFLKEGGFFAFEIGYNQGRYVSDLLKKYGFKTKVIKDLQNLDRVVIGER